MGDRPDGAGIEPDDADERGLYNGNNQIGSSPYDAAGNMTALPPGMTYSYDAENRQTVESNSDGLSANYYYDADVKRAMSTIRTNTW